MNEDERLDVRIAGKIAAREGLEPEELRPPLYEVIDVDALERLFRPVVHERGGTTGTVSFTYRDYTVTVDHTGDIDVTPVSSDVSVGRTVDVVHG